MEKVYGCGGLDYTSDPIRLRDFFNDASLQQLTLEDGSIDLNKTLTKTERENVFRERMMEMMDSNLTDSEFLDLENICSANSFKTSENYRPMYNIDQRSSIYVRVEPPPKSDLATLQKLTQRARIHERFLKYTGMVWLGKKITASDSGDSDLIPGNEIVATVRMYAPFLHELGKRTHKVAGGCQEIVILGSQTLADLRDSFTCSADNVICQDLSSNPFRKFVTQAKDKYKSGMLYIEETFYDDMRCPTNVEYSETVLNWAKERGIKLGKKANIEHTKIIDLTVKFGYPYLYQHQGNCEHLFCFSDVRLLHQSDLLKVSEYPVLRSFSKKHSRYCMLCGHFVAKWVTVGNSRVPHDPSYFCQGCFLSYNYINKKKIGEFSAYPFSDSAPEFVAQTK